MASSSSSAKRRYGSDLIRILRLILHRWWVILGVCATLALLSFGFANIIYKPQYVASTTLIINNRNTAASETEKYVTYTDVQASKQLAKTCTYILQSDQSVDMISDILGREVTPSDITGMTTLSVLQDTNIIHIEVKTNSAQTSYEIAQAIEVVEPTVIMNLLNAESVTRVNGAQMPQKAAPNEQAFKFLLLGLAAGLVVTVGGIVLRDITRNTVKSRADVSELGLPVLGVIPRASLKRYYGKSKKKRALLISDRLAEFSFVENYKAVRTKLEALASRENYRTLLVTSTLENEGKTTVSINLAIALAQNNKSVLLIDADLRKPALHQALEITDQLSVGLIQVLEGKMPWQKPVRRLDELGFDIIISGGVSDRSAELLNTEKMQAVIGEMQKFYDYVIVDSPPVHIVTDAAVLTEFVDAALLVVREDSAHVSDIIESMEQLEHQKAKLIGCVFNSAEEEESAGYRRGHYKSGYYGRKGYGGRYGGYGSGGYGYGAGYQYGGLPEKKERDSARKSKE